MLRKIEGRRRRGQQRVRWLNEIIYSMNMSLSKLWEIVKDREARGTAVHGVAKEPDTTKQQQKNKTPVSSVLLHYTFGGDADTEGL